MLKRSTFAGIFLFSLSAFAGDGDAVIRCEGVKLSRLTTIEFRETTVDDAYAVIQILEDGSEVAARSTRNGMPALVTEFELASSLHDEAGLELTLEPYFGNPAVAVFRGLKKVSVISKDTDGWVTTHPLCFRL